MKSSNTAISLKISYLNFDSNLPGANELKQNSLIAVIFVSADVVIAEGARPSTSTTKLQNIFFTFPVASKNFAYIFTD